MFSGNCLSEVLDRLNRDGGHGCFRDSAHSKLGMHALWLPPEGEMQHYVPPKPLRHPAQALLGFEGAWVVGDDQPAPPVPRWKLVLNSWVLALGTTGWALWRSIR